MASPALYLWYDADGVCREITQREGGEQGDALMPALFALAQHDALEEAAATLRSEERLFAFLDDLYVTSTKGRAHAAFQTVADKVLEKAGVQTNLGKLKAWSRAGGEAPEGLAGAWQGNKREADNGLVVLGNPLGTDAFVRRFAEKRLQNLSFQVNQRLVCIPIPVHNA